MSTTWPSVYLTGFMGAGKTSVGTCLAVELGLPFYDLDAAVVAGERRSIAAIFREDGEPVFRELEARYLTRLPLPAVVALGGGSFLTLQVRRYISKHGLSVFLDWPLPVLKRRVALNSDRPLAGDSAGFEALYRERLPRYRTADLTWRSRPPHEETAAEVARDVAVALDRRLGSSKT